MIIIVNLLTMVIRVLLLALLCPLFLNAQSISNTYTDADISTSLPPFNPLCNGPLTTLSLNLPSGGPWVVTGVDIEYEMLAQNGGFKSHQRSQVYCQNTERNEASVFAGTGNAEGVQEYSRTSVAIANEIYAGGTSLIFEMRAWRTMIGTGCNTTYNRVNNFTWTITVHYTMYVESGSVGVGTSSPDSSAVLDLRSATKGFLPPRMNTGLRLAIDEPAEGLVIYDSDYDKLFCYTGSTWVQLWDDFTSVIRDEDNDTKIQVEETSDEDIIRFDVNNIERWKMEGTRLEPSNTGSSIYIGDEAGKDDDLTNNCIGVGSYSLYNNISGNDNIAVGGSSMWANETGYWNTGIGYAALSNNEDGYLNTAIGHWSLNFNISGSENVYVGGTNVLHWTVDVNQCTLLGAQSSFTTERTNVTMLGYGITNSECTGNNQVLLGNTAISSIRAQVTGITAYSDARYKTNITEDIKGLDFIKRLRPVSYNVRPTELHKIWGTPDSLYQRIDHSEVEQMRFSGFLAQEVEQAALESNYSFTGIDVPRNEKETYSLRYTEFIVPMVKAMQEQQMEIEALKSEIELLKELMQAQR